MLGRVELMICQSVSSLVSYYLFLHDPKPKPRHTLMTTNIAGDKLFN